MNEERNMEDIRGSGKVGIKNMGNTCYINSASQCLSHTPLLRDFFLTKQFEKYQNKEHESSVLIDQWYDMMKRLWASNTGGINPRGYIYNVQAISRKHGDFAMFGGFSQNDSQEYLGFFMNQLHDVIERPVKFRITGEIKTPNGALIKKAYDTWVSHFRKSYSIFTEIFYGSIINIVECPTTKEKSCTFEPQGMFPISIPEHTHDNSLTLDHCFQSYIRHSVLDGDNAWQSEKTGKKHRAYRYTRFWKLPKYMVIILKRFDMMGNKRNDEVEFPEVFDMTPYTALNTKNMTYKLYSVINHYGSSRGGHYVAHCRNDDNWACFDDLMVRDVSVETVLSEKRSAYVLFYEKQE